MEKVSNFVAVVAVVRTTSHTPPSLLYICDKNMNLDQTKKSRPSKNLSLGTVKLLSSPLCLI
jgi:hypothetical protein